MKNLKIEFPPTPVFNIFRLFHIRGIRAFNLMILLMRHQFLIVLEFDGLFRSIPFRVSLSTNQEYPY